MRGWRWRRRERGSRKTWRYEYLTFRFLALKWQAMKEALQGSKYERVWEDLQPTFRREFVKISPGPKLTEGLISITFKKPEVSFKEILCEMNKFKMRYPDKAFKRLVIEVQDFGTVDPKSTGIGVENKVTTLTLDTCPTRLEKAKLKKKEEDAYKAKIQVNILGYNLFINVVI